MASLNDYAKLTYHKTNDTITQFRPEDSVTFEMKYSEGLNTYGMYATLIIYGYEQRFYDVDPPLIYNGYKETHPLGSGIAGQLIAVYTIPGNTLGKSPDNYGNEFYYTGKMQAKVEIGTELDEDGYVINPVFTSNIVLVDMMVADNADIRWLRTPYNTSTSKIMVSMEFGHAITYGVSGNSNVQSYRLWLYDRNKNLLRDTGELYDWDSNVYGNGNYVYYDLKDGFTYYVKGRVTLVGGYVFNYDYEPIHVDYDTPPSPSANFTIEQQIGKVTLSLDLTGITYTKVIFTRTVQYEGEYLEIQNTIDDGNIVTAEDRYPIAGKKYEYVATVFNGELIVGTYYNYLDYTSNCIAISDIFACYTAIGKITKHPISRNDRGQIVETMDSKMPYHIMNGKADYDSGTVDALFSEVEECQVVTDNGDVANAMRAWLNNGRAKLLTYYNGEAWIVSTSAVQTTDPENNDVYNTTFKWTQIGDANRISEYVRLGLVIDV